MTTSSDKVGGNGGIPFSDKEISSGKKITEIIVHHSSFIDGIQIVYDDVKGEYHGGYSGTKSSFKLKKGETIVQVEGKYGDVIEQLKFKTNFGRCSETFGENQGGKPFSVGGKGKYLSYIGGKCSSYLDCLEFFWDKDKSFTNIDGFYQKISAFITDFKEEEEMIRQREELLNIFEQHLLKAKEKICYTKIVKINVGGQPFRTSLDTLTKIPSSNIAKMFTENTLPFDEKEQCYFIDRDGTHFRHILNYLRDGAIPTLTVEEHEEVLREGEFYGLHHFVEELKKKEPIRMSDEEEELEELKRIYKCTYLETGRKYKTQTYYRCFTCGLTGNLGCCEPCSKVCHKGHSLSAPLNGSFFCDCAENPHLHKLK